MSQRRLQKAAPELLEAAKSALRMLINGAESDGNVRTSVVQSLVSAIDRADPPVLEPEISLVMTPASYDLLCQEVDHHAAHDTLGASLSSAVHQASRVTLKRVYLTLQTNRPELLRRLRTIMDRATHTKQTRRAFERMVEQLDKEAINRSPLIRLAEAAL
jgi:hypothetical protein